MCIRDRHEKVWIFDDAYVMMGSHNLTHNSLNNCEETIEANTACCVVDAHLQHHADLWEACKDKQLTEEYLRELIQAKAKKLKGKSRSSEESESVG